MHTLLKFRLAAGSASSLFTNFTFEVACTAKAHACFSSSVRWQLLSRPSPSCLFAGDKTINQKIRELERNLTTLTCSLEGELVAYSLLAFPPFPTILYSSICYSRMESAWNMYKNLSDRIQRSWKTAVGKSILRW